MQSDNMYCNVKDIYLGKNAREPLVLGNELVDVLKNLIDVINQLTVMTGTGQSSPPVNRADFIRIN